MGKQMHTGFKRSIQVLFCVTLLVALVAVTGRARAGTPYAQAVGAPPVCTSATFRTWCARLYSYRLAECPLGQPNAVYVSQAGSDSNPGTFAQPIKTLARLNQLEAASAGRTTYLLRRGDAWNETPPSTPILSQSGNTLQISSAALTFTPVVGSSLLLTGGTREKANVAGWSPATGTITLEAVPAGSGHTSAQSLAGIALGHISEVVSDYADGTPGHTASASLPTLTQFRAPYNISDWQNSATRGDAFSNTFSQNETGTVAWLRVAGDNSSMLRKQASVADVDANPGSWYADGARIWLSPLPDYGAPNNGFRQYQSVYFNYGEGIVIANVDKCRIHNIRVEGYGANINLSGPAAIAYAGYAIHGNVQDTNALVVDGCEAYYSNRHSICNVHGGRGGIWTLSGCKAGWTTGDTIHFIAYAQSGGQEFVSWENESTSGQAAFGQTPFGDRQAGSGMGSYAHTSGGNAQNTNNIALFLSWGARNRAGQYQISGYDGPSATDAWQWTGLKDCRAFVVGQTFSAREPTAFDRTAPSESGLGILGANFAPATTYINCDLVSRTVFNSNPRGPHEMMAFVTNGRPLYILNTRLLADFSFDPPQTFPVQRFLTGSDSGVGSQGGVFDHCRVTFRVLGGGQVGWDERVADANNASFVAGTSVQNSILGADGLGTNGLFYLGLGNNTDSPTQLVSNCYSNVTDKSGVRGYDQDPYLVEAGDLPFGPPPPGSPLLTTHSPRVMGQYTLEYDADWNLRSLRTPAIGPYEPIKLPSF